MTSVFIQKRILRILWTKVTGKHESTVAIVTKGNFNCENARKIWLLSVEICTGMDSP